MSANSAHSRTPPADTPPVLLDEQRHRLSLTPKAYARITVVAVWLIGLIVVTGGAVRLTASGLGCTDWPTCQANQVYPSWHWHAWVEFGNRLVTGLVSLAVVVRGAGRAGATAAAPRPDVALAGDWSRGWWARSCSAASSSCRTSGRRS